MVTIEDLQKLDLRIVEVVEAVPMEGSEKLLKLIVNDGEGKRQILSGISKSYKPTDLIGKKLVAIVNLEPRKMMGEQSNGMILATGDGLSEISLLIPDKNVAPGATIR